MVVLLLLLLLHSRRPNFGRNEESEAILPRSLLFGDDASEIVGDIAALLPTDFCIKSDVSSDIAGCFFPTWLFGIVSSRVDDEAGRNREQFWMP